MLIAAEVFIPLRLFFVLLLFDTGQARIWRWLPQSACQSEFSKNSDWRKQYGVQQSQIRKEMAALERSRGKTATEFRGQRKRHRNAPCSRLGDF